MKTVLLTVKIISESVKNISEIMDAAPPGRGVCKCSYHEGFVKGC